MEEKVSKQVETSPTLDRKRAKYTVEDVRQLCGGISRSTVMREIRRKRLACYRARRTLRFSEEHITKYLERVEQGKDCIAGNGPGKAGLADGATTSRRRK
jgi:excisionase family DNA binding protein